jgi:hypothetical protein
MIKLFFNKKERERKGRHPVCLAQNNKVQALFKLRGGRPGLYA